MNSIVIVDSNGEDKSKEACTNVMNGIIQRYTNNMGIHRNNIQVHITKSARKIAQGVASIICPTKKVKMKKMCKRWLQAKN